MAVVNRNNNWHIDYYLPNGKRKREKIGSSRKIAERVLEKRKIQIMEGKFFDIDKIKKIKLKKFSDLFIESYSKPNKRTWRDDVNHLSKFCSCCGDIYLNEVTSQHIEEFKMFRLKQEVKPVTVNRSLEVVKTMFYRAIEWGYAKVHPMKNVKFYKVDSRRDRFLEKDEIERLFPCCAPHIKRIVMFALNTGLRKGEILGLKWSEVDFTNRLIYIYRTKNNERRVLSMSSVVSRLLLQIKEHYMSDFVFCKEDGSRLGDIKTGFTKALKRAGIDDFRFHDLRHTFASHLVMNGVDLSTVKELMGHKSIEMTMRYSHLSKGHKDHAVEQLGQQMDTIWTLAEDKEKCDNLEVLQLFGNK